MISLRQKLIIGLTLLVVLILGTAAVLFVKEKQDGLISDAYTTTFHYTEFTADTIAKNYDLYWLQKGFVFFNREMASLLSKSDVVRSIRIYSYSGELLYDSGTESEKPYSGAKRLSSDTILLSQIQSKLTSIQDEKSSVYFLKKDASGNIAYFDATEKQSVSFDPTIRLKNFSTSVKDQYSIVYELNYDVFNQKLIDIRNRMIALAAFGILIGIIFSIFFSSRIVGPIRQLVDTAAVLSKGDYSGRVTITTGDELEVLGKSFNTMAEEIDKNTRLALYKERVTKELELAAKIQTEILPKKLPNLPSLDISAGIIPAEEVGGDCYDFLEIADRRMIFYLGDATGHGVPAGIMVSVANALFYYLSHRKALMEIMVEANSVIKAKTANNMFMTLACLEWNDGDKTLRYVNAGHEPLLIYHTKDKKAEEVRGGGMALGMLPDNSKILKEMTLNFEIGDTLVMYSDGLPECWKNEKECYGMERLTALVAQHGGLPSSLAIRNAILSDIKQYAGDYKQMDDMTIIVVKRKL